MLKELADYAVKHGLEAEPGFAPKEVRWTLQFTADGRFIGVVELGAAGEKNNKGRRFIKAPEFSFPDMKSGGVTKSHFLIETADVVTLIGNELDKKTIAKHNYFIKLLNDSGRVYPELSQIAKLLSDEQVLQEMQVSLTENKVKPTEKVTLQIDDEFPVESNLWHDWWRALRKEIAGECVPKGAMRCFITGEMVEPAKTHDKIKGLADVGGSSMGAPFIGFDKDAFSSFGLEQSANAAVSQVSVSSYRSALNDLIAKHSERLGGARMVHWFAQSVPPEFDPFPYLINPNDNETGQDKKSKQEEQVAQQQAREVLQSLREGKRPELMETIFYALSLSGASGRVMVRDWMEGRFEELVANTWAWFDDLSITHRQGGSVLAPWPKFISVLGATVRDLDDLHPPLVSKMWRVALHNEPIPTEVMAQTLARVKIDIIQDTPFNHARMGLLKAYHIRKYRKEGGSIVSEELKPYLNENHPSLAYHCGRLMAVLAALQHSALGDVGAGIVQRYYAAASSTPALVLGRLDRTSKFHLNKLSPGLAWHYEEKLASIWQQLKDGPPKILTLEEQSLFALGYYQQLADLRTKKSTPAEDNEATIIEGDN